MREEEKQRISMIASVQSEFEEFKGKQLELIKDKETSLKTNQSEIDKQLIRINELELSLKTASEELMLEK